MTRFSHSIADLVSSLDGVAGKYFSDATYIRIQGGYGHLRKEILLTNGGLILEKSGITLEKAVARPLYKIENLIFGVPILKPDWTYTSKP